MSADNTVDARGPECNDPHVVALQAAEQARRAIRQLEAEYRSGARQRPGEIDRGRVELLPRP